MALPALVFRSVTFTHPAASRPLFEGVDLHLAPGWTGVVGANGAGKTTLLRLACGELAAGSGHVRAPRAAVLCEQRTDAPPERLDELLASSEPHAVRRRSALALEDDFATRWDSLSHGERKRAQVGVALWLQPDLLALDEPTNHLDAEARSLLLAALGEFRGVGLLVSHDRALLDALCAQCVFLDPPRVVLRPGGFSEARARERRDEATARAACDSARAERQRLEVLVDARRREAVRGDACLSKRHLARHDSDGRARIDRARVSNKVGRAGARLRQASARLDVARERAAATVLPARYETGISLEADACPRDVLAWLPQGVLALGPARWLAHHTIAVHRGERIGLSGRNGGGKSTLLRALLAQAALPEERVVVLPQELDERAGAALLREVRALPGPRLGEVMNLISRMGSRPGQLLESAVPSPGEARKLLLALGLERRAWLVVADEPTNHLDLPSIEALEEALSAWDGALLLASHDERFLDALTTTRWALAEDGEGSILV